MYVCITGENQAMDSGFRSNG